MFRYHFLNSDVSLRIWGDGREIGGRHSVLIGMSVVNHEIRLRGGSFQDPKEVYPLLMCYESDSRDNLEENMTKPNFLENFLKNLPQNVNPFLCGDHMFLQSILGREGELSPTTDTGWNLYSVTKKEDKKRVGSNGLRTEIKYKFDREHPNSLLPSMPLENVVFCLLHGIVRVVGN